MLPLVSMALAPAPGLPDDRLVLGLHPPERVAVLDVATATVTQRRLPGGTLCRGPLMTSGARPLDLRATTSCTCAPRAPAPSGRCVSGPATAARSPAARSTGAGHTLFRRAAARRPAIRAAASRAASSSSTAAGTGSGIRAPAALRPAGGEWLVGASERGSAWCDGHCGRLRIRAGGRSRASAPGGTTFLPGSGRFAPDGSRLAVALSGAARRDRAREHPQRVDPSGSAVAGRRARRAGLVAVGRLAVRRRSGAPDRGLQPAHVGAP